MLPAAPRKIYVIRDGTTLSDCSYPSNARIIHDCVRTEQRNAVILYKAGPGVASGLTIFNKMGATAEAILGTETKSRLFETLLEISKNYNAGDELHFLGFSRGAFEVRSLVAIIRRYGIVKRVGDYRRHLQTALDEYYEVNLRYQAALYSPNSNETNLATYRRQFEAVNENANFYSVEHVNSLFIFDTVPGLSNKDLWQHDIHEHRGFVLKWAHLMASEVTHFFQNFSYVKHADGNRFQCGNINEDNRVEKQYYGDHCNIGGSWLKTPSTLACVSNNVLHKMVELALAGGWDLNSIKGKYPEIDEEDWRRGIGVFGVYSVQRKPEHDDQLGSVMPLLHDRFNTPVVIDRTDAIPGNLDPNCFPPQPNYIDMRKNGSVTLGQTFFFLLSHYGGHAFHVAFLAKQGAAFSLLMRGAAGVAICAPSSVFGVYLFVLTDAGLVACGKKSPFKLLVNAAGMVAGAGAVLAIGPFAYSGWALLAAIQGSYYAANAFVDPEAIHRRIWYKNDE